MKILLILVFLTMACSGPRVDQAANTAPVHPLPPPNPEVEKRELAQPEQVGSVSLAVVDVQLPPPEEVAEWGWEKAYFEEIAEREKLSMLGPLRSRVVSGSDIELRIWRGFGVTLLQGFVLRRSGGRWSAMDLGWASSTVGKGNHRISPKDRRLNEPEAGWDVVWQRLSDAGVHTLPRREETNCPKVGTLDGISFVVEYKADNKYRNYMYDNPEGNCDEERRVLQVWGIIDGAFYST